MRVRLRVESQALCVDYAGFLPQRFTKNSSECFADTPDWTADMSADYVVPTAIGKIGVNVTYYHNSGWYGSVYERLRQPAYDVVNAALSLTSTNGHWRATLWGKNLANEEYAVYLAAQANGDSIQYAPPRIYGVTLQYEF